MEKCVDPIKSHIEKTLELLGEAYKTIYKHGKREKYWDDVRSTALVGLALAIKEPVGSKWRKMVSNYLERNQGTDKDETGGSWNAEVWDTGLSILSLQKLNQNVADGHIHDGVKWIHKVYNKQNGVGNWNDEPWETSWGAIAMLTVGRLPAGFDISEPIEWLLKLRKDDKGTIISPHYNAFYLMIHHLLAMKSVNLEESQKSRYDQARTMILDIFRNEAKKKIWAGEAWSNGYILWAIADTCPEFFKYSAGGEKDETRIIVENVLEWFDKPGKKGFWSDWEDTASAVIGLHKMLEAIVDVNGVKLNIIEDLNKKAPSPKVFISPKFWERDKEAGGINIHISGKLIAIIAAGSGVLVTLLLWLLDKIF